MASAMVAVLFTDMVGSTELLARTGDAAADAARHVHFAALRRAIDEHGGDEVKNLGDGLMVTFTSAADAVACAAAMQQRASSVGGVGLRVGLAVGEASKEDGDWFGTPVVEAARLCGEAAGGQILATDLVRVFAGSRCQQRIEPLGFMELKGFSEPVAVVDVRWEPTDQSVGTPPMPSQLSVEGAMPFSGREEERAGLLGHWKRAVTGGRVVVLLGGEPGVGKTRLAAEVALAAHDDDGTVLLGRCDEELDIAYRPFAEAIRHLVAHLDDDELRDHIAAHGGELGRLAPELATRIPDLPGPIAGPEEVERGRLFDAVAGLVSSASRRAPVLLVLDDLHWADRSSLLLLRHLVRSELPMSLLVIGTYRDTDLARSHPLAGMLADFRREPCVHRYALDGLDESALVALMISLGGADSDTLRDLASAVWAETEGNAFFVGEVLRHLAEAGHISQDEHGVWLASRPVSEMGVPEGIKEVVGRRLSRLSDATNALLAVAAVVGRDFDVPVVAAAAEVQLDAALGALDEAVTARLVAEVSDVPGRYTFGHALVRSTVYEELTASRRARLHQTVGEVLEAGGRAAAATIAVHYGEAAMGDPERAVRWLLKAGDEAMAGLAWEQAERWYVRALDADDLCDREPTRRARVLLALGSARNAMGDAAPARTLFVEAAALARGLGDAELLAEAALGYGGIGAFWIDPLDTVGPALAAEAERALPRSSVLRTRVLCRQNIWLTLAPTTEVRVALAEEALALARDLGDDMALVEALFLRMEVLRGRPSPVELSTFAGELHDVASRVGDGAGICRALYNRATAQVLLGDADAALATTAEMREQAARCRDVVGAWSSIAIPATHHLHRGDFEQGLALNQEALAAGAAVGAGAVVCAGYNSVLQTWLGGDDAAAADGLEQFWTGPDSLAVFGPPDTPDKVATLAAFRGELDRARQVLPAMVAHMASQPAMLEATNLINLVQVVEATGDVTYEQLARDRLDAWHGLTVSVGPEVPGVATDELVARLDRLVGALDAAVAGFDSAIALYDGGGYRLYRAGALVRLAATLVERNQPGDRDRAHVLAADAASESRSLGLPGWLSRSEALLAELIPTSGH